MVSGAWLPAVVLATEAGEGGSPDWLTEVVALVLAGAVIAYVSQRAGIVPIVGFLLAGVLIGPNALGLVRSQEVVEQAAEIGVILLLFTIGLEFSIGRLMAIRRLIFGGGALQVGLATLAAVALLTAVGQSWQVGVYTGFLIALSSTAIVLKLNSDRGVTNTPQGQVALGLLLFQDLAIVVMVLLVPMLSGSGGSALDILRALGTAAGVIVVVLLVARRLMPVILEVVARACSPEVFLLSVIAICLGTAFLTNLAGVSVSLGAFLAGLVVSESRFSDQAFGEVLPLQILFSAVFFVSVGMLLDLRFLVANLGLVLLAVAVVIVIKVVTTALSARVLGYSLPVAATAAFSLAQIGEFSFVLERAGRDVGLTPGGLGASGSQTFIAATVVLMVLTPVLARVGDLCADRLTSRRGTRPAPDPDDEVVLPETDLTDHVIVAGYGQAARMITDVLATAMIPHIVTTLSPEGAQEAEDRGHSVVRGDAGRQRTLQLAGMSAAQVLVVADDDPSVAQRVAAVGRNLNPGATILVRTRYNAEADPLTAAGASYVVTEEHASAAAVTEKVLRGYRLAEEDIREAIVRLWHARHRPEDADGEAARTRREEQADRARRLSAAGTVIDTQRRVTLRADPAICSHVDSIHPVMPSAPGCEECLETGDRWVHLRICLFCGHVGCCDSSPNRHATRHFEHARHPIVTSGEPGEDWGWCYVDQTLLPNQQDAERAPALR